MKIKLLLSVAIITVSLNAADAVKALDDGAGSRPSSPGSHHSLDDAVPLGDGQLTPRSQQVFDLSAQVTTLRTALEALTGGGLNTAVGFILTQRKAEFKGEDGTPGLDGANGLKGEDGKDGAPGLQGADGKDGAPGLQGADGRDGIDGATVARVLAGARTNAEFFEWVGKTGADAYRVDKKAKPKGFSRLRAGSMRRNSRRSRASEASTTDAVQDETIPSKDLAATELENAAGKGKDGGTEATTAE
jgi:hypothetical protein